MQMLEPILPKVQLHTIQDSYKEFNFYTKELNIFHKL